MHSIITALIFNATDLVTGIIQALKNHELNSSKLRDGLFKKIAFIACYFMAWLLDTEGASVGFNLAVQILPCVILYAVTTEIISIIENISKINPDLLPEKLMSLFHIANQTGDEQNGSGV